MMIENYFNGFVFGVLMHWFFEVMLLMGLVLMVVWMAKYVEEGRLIRYVLFMIIAGAVGFFFTLEFNIIDFSDVINDVGEIGDFGNEDMMDLEETI